MSNKRLARRVFDPISSAVADDDDEGALSMKHRLESEYSRALHQRHRVSGQLWQGRFRSSVLDEANFCVGLAYVE